MQRLSFCKPFYCHGLGLGQSVTIKRFTKQDRRISMFFAGAAAGMDSRDAVPQRSLLPAYYDASRAGRGGFNWKQPRRIQCFRASTRTGEVHLLLAEPARGGYGATPAARPAARPHRSSHDNFKLRLHSLARPPAVGGCQQRRRWFRAEWVRWRHGARRSGLVTGDPLRRWPGTKRRKGRVNDRFATGSGPPRPRHRA